MSEKARELAKDIEYPEIEERFLSAIGREVLDEIALKIDAAVAPLVSILQDIADAVENSDRSLLDRAIAQIPQHLAAWRK